ncbi:S-DNA-T family DNA segregation ATPase FtsK/SpoIIIE [Nocardioides luteus]|uniref:FtsK/SpoIIIE domain-containing protein n=1 Tax=Nocardioides luteus TaxID=1844 RepID=UPI002862F7F7|nr:FtsK/SpoIIIE domain-containing protein [Nocardioides luteus]MDR7313607.1 S-DNA-T family DNA segregation ATPase FtsK/SpoIIIE [Nocardioides luteus]
MNETIYMSIGGLPALAVASLVVIKPTRPATLAALGWLASIGRRVWWWLVLRVTWKAVAREAGLSKRRTKRVKRMGVGEESIEKWRDPRLKRVKPSAHSVTLKVRTRRGQALADLEAFAPKLAATYSADAYRVYPPKRRAGSTVMFELVMRDLIKTPSVAAMPEPRMQTESVRLGRRQSGKPFDLQIEQRHTLVVGASGAGKGSFLWGVVGSLAPAIAVDAVRAYGIDLKGGMELTMGAPLFTKIAVKGEQAVEMLREFVGIADERTEAMRGHSRNHKPGPGDPLYLLVIDELASLTAYADNETKKEAERLLKRLLSIGRAVGVVVVAFVQDPRKEVIDMRGLFTQTIALRLRSAMETNMVLGDGMAPFAPAHRILKGAQGTAWIIDEDGSTDRIRADYWSDELIRRIASLYPADPTAAPGAIAPEPPALGGAA